MSSILDVIGGEVLETKLEARYDKEKREIETMKSNVI